MKFKKKTQEKFIEELNNIFGNIYDFSNVNYIGTKIKVDVVCSIHGLFSISPAKLLANKGCQKCAFNSRVKKTTKTNDLIINQIKDVHGDRFDLSEINYKGAHKKIKIICKIHGIFLVTPDSILHGTGCKKCSIKSQALTLRKTLKEFIDESNIIHNHKYDYSESEYININTKLKIKCYNHGYFMQIPSNHLKGVGCHKCHLESGNKKHLNKDDFLQRAVAVHGENYSYNLVEYKTTKDKIKIICNNHGESHIFEQTISAHLVGKGCIKWSKQISKPETLWLDSLNICKENRQFKIKINNKLFKVDGFDSDTNTIYEFYGDYWHGNPNKYEQNKVHPVNKKTYGELYYKTIKKEMILKMNGYKIISIWESEWNELIKKKYGYK